MFTIPAAGGQATQINSSGLGGWFPTFAPDGNSFIFYGAKNAAQFVAGLDFGSLTPIPTATGPAATATATVAPTTAAITGTPAATVTIAPTATPAPPAVIGLYRINRDGTNLKQLAEIENPPVGQKIENSRFATYIANSAEITALLASRPSFLVAPVWSSDGKQVAGLLAGVGHDTAGITVVSADGGTAVNIVSGENGLENGTRLSPVFSGDGSRVYYWFQAPGKDAKKVLRYFDLNTKKETTVVSNNDNAFPSCCGFKK
jgi:hypothetical protein